MSFVETEKEILNDYENDEYVEISEGIPYQTLIASLIHRYISGKLVEKDKVSINQ